MRRTLGQSSVIALWLLAGAASFPAHADLIGATVTIAGYCCTAPTPADLFTNTPTGTVPVSFPVGSFISVTSRAIIPSSFDVTADQIIQTSAASLRAASGSFNGVVYTFSGGPDIINVTVDPRTTPSVVPTSISFTSNSISVNDADLVTTVGAMQILDITTSTGPVPPVVTTPEPSTIALLGAGLVGLAGFGVRRRRKNGEGSMRRTLARSSSVIVLWLLAGAVSFPAQADLVGATVTIAGYCCTAPIPADQFTNTLRGTVPVSFPVGSLQTTTSLAVVPSSFDVTANQIIQTSAAAEQAAGGSFNGVLYTFSGAPNIINVTVDPQTTPAVMPAGISFTSNSIAVNDAGLVSTVGARQILDITTSAIPLGSSPLTRSLSGEYNTLNLFFGLASDYYWFATAVTALRGNPIAAIGPAFLASISSGISRVFGFLANDPVDPNYMALATPSSVNIPTNLGAFAPLSTDELKAIALIEALLTSNDRYQGAVVAGDSFLGAGTT